MSELDKPAYPQGYREYVSHSVRWVVIASSGGPVRALVRRAAPPARVATASIRGTTHDLDRWPSGLRRTPGKCVYVKAYREFESHPIRC